ncbi:hypothetical protein BJ170DRAFT_729218 [Xylariales sp. AK1849]|nr:hypothetical protein BJ170DRAFT_729218 [Xylariales sp. AK1849]
MRYRDMIVDNYQAAGGNLKTLQYLGTMSVLNELARDWITKEFEEQGKNPMIAGQVEMAYDSLRGYCEDQKDHFHLRRV